MYALDTENLNIQIIVHISKAVGIFLSFGVNSQLWFSCEHQIDSCWLTFSEWIEDNCLVQSENKSTWLFF